MKKHKTKHDGLENRSLGCNIIFYELDDAAKETWSEAGLKKLDRNILSSDIEHAPRLGQYKEANTKSIIFNCCVIASSKAYLKKIIS